MSDETTVTDEVAPRDEAREALLVEVTKALGGAVVDSHIEVDAGLWIRVKLVSWQDTFRTLKNLGFVYFGFISAIDWADAPDGRYENTEFDGELAEEPDAEEAPAAGSSVQATGYAGGDTQFQVLAQLAAPGRGESILIKTDVTDPGSIDTVRDIFAGADWHERELYEMFGIDVIGHPGLHPLYLPTGFEGHPLRKDFPLLARQVKPWPGVVDIEEIPEHLEEQLEAEVMAAFEAEGGGA
jgi:NADH-quinone oxidoreductase subunit C